MSMHLTHDDTLTETVEKRLAGDERTEDAIIEVTTSAGEVTLRGSVDAEGIKEAAEQIANAVDGASLVINELIVTTTEQRAEDNAWPPIPIVAPTTSGQGYATGVFPTNGSQF